MFSFNVTRGWRQEEIQHIMKDRRAQSLYPHSIFKLYSQKNFCLIFVLILSLVRHKLRTALQPTLKMTKAQQQKGPFFLENL